MAEENVVLVKRRRFEEVCNQKMSDTIRELMFADCVAHATERNRRPARTARIPGTAGAQFASVPGYPI